jgi:hypothetical protein
MKNPSDTPAASSAADAIVALINSRVQSPTKAEIAAIIAKVSTAGSADCPPSSLMSELRRLRQLRAEAVTAELNVEQYGSEKYLVAQARAHEVESALDEVVEQVWKKPTGDLLADIALRTEIVATFAEYNQSGLLHGLLDPDDDPPCGRSRAWAELLLACARLTGTKLASSYIARDEEVRHG